jgi:ribosomal protein S7
VVKTTSKKRGGKNVLFPKPLEKRQQSKIGINWILEQASKSKKKGILGCIDRLGIYGCIDNRHITIV